MLICLSRRQVKRTRLALDCDDVQQLGDRRRRLPPVGTGVEPDGSSPLAMICARCAGVKRTCRPSRVCGTIRALTRSRSQLRGTRRTAAASSIVNSTAAGRSARTSGAAGVWTWCFPATLGPRGERSGVMLCSCACCSLLTEGAGMGDSDLVPRAGSDVGDGGRRVLRPMSTPCPFTTAAGGAEA